MQALLAAADHEVLAVDDGDQACRINGEFEAGIALVDCGKGAAGDFELLARLKRESAASTTIAIGATLSAEAAVEALRHGADDYLPRPPSEADVLAALERGKAKLRLQETRLVMLRESDARLRDVIEGSIQGIIVTRGVKPIFANRAYAEMFGYDSPEEVVALESEAPLVAPEEHDRLTAYAEARHRGEDAPAAYEFRGVRKDGRRIWVDNRVRMVDWWGGPAILSTVIDITDRKQAEQALRRGQADLQRAIEERTAELSASNERLRAEIAERERVEEELRQSQRRFQDYAEASADWFWEMDADLRFTYMSPNVERIAGRPAEWHYGKTRREVMDEDYDPEVWAAHLETLEAHEPFRDFTFCRVEPEGERWISSSGIPVHAEDGRFLGYRGSGRDVTARLRAAAALRSNEAQLRLITDSLPVLITFLDKDQHYRFANATCAAWYGRPAAEITGRSAEEVLGSTYDDFRPLVEAGLAGESVTFERRIGYPDGITRDVRAHYVPRFGEDGTVEGLFTLVEDITERKHAEEEAQRARRNLEDAIESISQAIILYDADDRVVMFNSRFANDHSEARHLITPGRRFEDMIRDTAEHGLVGEAVGRIDEFLRERLAHHAKADGTPLLRQLNDGRYLEVTETRTGDGGIVGVGTDITETVRREQELRDSRDQLRLVTDNLPVMINYVDAEQRFRFMNKVAATWYGRPTTEMLGLTVAELAGPAAYAKFRPIIETALSGESISAEEVIRYPDGAERMVEIFYVPDFGEDGEVRGYFALVSDIGERKRAEAAAQRNRLHLEDAIESINQAIILYDSDDRIVLFNSKYADLYPDAKDLITVGNRFEDLVRVAAERGALPEAVGRVEDFLRERVALHDKGDGTPLIRQLKDGRFQEITDFRSRDGGIVSVTTDITETVWREQELRDSRDQLRLVTDNLPVLIAYLDADKRFRFVNKVAETWYARPASELMGEMVTDLLDEAAYAKLAPHIESTLDGNMVHFEESLDYPDGGSRAVEIAYVPDFGEDGEVRGYFGLVADITERKRAEEALHESEERFRAVFDQAAVGIGLMTASGWFLRVNDKLCELMRREREDLTAANFRDFTHADDYAACVEQAARVMTGEIPTFTIEMRYLPAEGELMWGNLTVSAIRQPDSDQVVLLGIVEDITERKQVEDQLRQAQKMEAVGQLTGGVAHDFNNLLMVVLGNLELIEERVADDPTVARLTSTATKAAQRGAELTRRLLAFSRQQPLEPSTVDINKLVLGTGELLRRTLGESIDLETVLAGGLWPAMVDPGQLENALINVAVNARDAMADSGKLTFETANARLDHEYAAREAEVRPGQYVMIAISDTGAGMAPDLVGRVFDPFFTTKPVGEGSGLGLSMVYGFVKQSGGHVAIYSEVGQGTTIRLYLPRATPGATTGESAAMRDAPLPTGKETVLVVEDDPDVRTFVLSALEGLGYQVLEAPHGPAALDLLQRAVGVDLLLTDVVLPHGMNGRELAEEIARTRPEIRKLFMSGYTENAIIHHGRLDPDVELLAKPFTRDVLAHRLRAVLDGPRRD